MWWELAKVSAGIKAAAAAAERDDGQAAPSILEREMRVGGTR